MSGQHSGLYAESWMQWFSPPLGHPAPHLWELICSLLVCWYLDSGRYLRTPISLKLCFSFSLGHPRLTHWATPCISPSQGEPRLLGYTYPMKLGPVPPCSSSYFPFCLSPQIHFLLPSLPFDVYVVCRILAWPHQAMSDCVSRGLAAEKPSRTTLICPAEGST